MNRNIIKIALPLLLCAAAPAATTTTTLTVNATATIGTSITATGPATLTNGIGNGTFNGSISTSTFSGPYTLTLTGGTITGTITVSATILTGTGTASMTISGGSGSYSGASGSFPNLAGSATGVGAGTSFTLTFTGAGTIVTGGTGGGSAPTVSAIQNNYSYISAGFPNYGISPGALFIVKGTGLADPSAQAVLQTSASPGIPATLNGASISVTVNGITVHPGIYYAIATQIAAVLPANTPAGTGTLTVTYNGTPSAAATMTVVPAALGFGTYNGLAIATNPTTGVLYSNTNSVKPGETIVLWGSGLGAITADSDTVFTSTPHASTTTLQIFIGGVAANVPYAGDSGFPGVNQINVVVPSSVPPGCNVSLVAVTGSGSGLFSSNSTALPIATGGGTCTDPFSVSGNPTGATVKSGTVYLVHSTSTVSGTSQVTDGAIASFASVTGTPSAGSNPSVGSCVVNQIGTGTTTSKGLNAGSVTLTGPAGSTTLTSNPVLPGSYIAALASGFIPTSGGTFTFAGTGGSDVGSFNVSVTFPSPALTWTNTAASATVNRTQGQTISWTGGAPNSYVVISGNSAVGQASGSYVCIAPVAAGQFTVPLSILLNLPAGPGTTLVENIGNFQSFSASGLDSGTAFAAVVVDIATNFN